MSEIDERISCIPIFIVASFTIVKIQNQLVSIKRKTDFNIA